MNAALPLFKTVEIALTGKCNLHCQYCFYNNEMAALGDLPAATWLALFQELGRLGLQRVTLTGGEALTRRDFFELLDGLIASRLRYSLLSNGTLIDEKMIARFELGKRRLRMDSIQISLDGSCAEVHDRSRPHSFERALAGLRLLKGAGFPVTVRTTINRHNLHDLENIAALLLEDIGLPSFSTNSALPMGAGCDNQADITLSPAEKLEAMHILQALRQKYPNRLKASAGPQANQEMYAEMEQARRSGEKSTRWQMGYLSACGCVFSKLAILHDGGVVPCHMLHDIPLGNIAASSLKEIWRSHPVLMSMRSRSQIPLAQVPGCSACEWNAYCNGSCPGMAYEMTGEINRANPDDCYRDFLSQTARPQA